MKVLLLNSPWINNAKEYGVKSGTRWAAIRKKDRSMPYFPFPYLLASTAHFLRKEGFNAYIKDAIADETSKDECLYYIKNFKVNLLVLEAFTPSINFDLTFAKEAKEETGCMIALCGAHPTALPIDMLENDFIDFVLLGEYCLPLKNLCTTLSRKSNEFERIEGLAYKRNGVIKTNGIYHGIKNLDKIPPPDVEELSINKYNEPLCKYFPNAKVVTTRGCPHNCTFCVEPFMYGQNYRKRSVNLVLDEIKILITKYGVKEIYFDDDLFTIPRAKEIASALLENNIKIAWSSWVDWRIGVEDLKLLKQSGCVAIKLGIESSNLHILKLIGKGNTVNIDKITKLIKECQKLSILSHGSFMFGLPSETNESMQKTLDLAFSLNFNSTQFSIATPLPGTSFYKEAKVNGWIVTDDWTQYESLYSCVLDYPECKREQICNAIEQARRRKVKQFLKNPLVALGYILKMYKFRGARTFFKEIWSKTYYVLTSIFYKS